MAIDKSIYHWERVVMVQFMRCVDPAHPAATSGAPRGDCPDPDERGYASAAHGPLMSVCLLPHAPRSTGHTLVSPTCSVMSSM